MSEELDHSRLGPSSASRWVSCPGSIDMQERHPDVRDKSAADEGTLAHADGEALLTGREPEREPNEATMVWVNDMKPYLGYPHGVEDRIEMRHIHEGMFGTADGWALVETHLIVWDFKHGFTYVEEFENLQGICYLSGLRMKLGDAVKTFEVRIVQPNAYGHAPVRTPDNDTTTSALRFPPAPRPAFNTDLTRS